MKNLKLFFVGLGITVIGFGIFGAGRVMGGRTQIDLGLNSGIQLNILGSHGLIGVGRNITTETSDARVHTQEAYSTTIEFSEDQLKAEQDALYGDYEETYEGEELSYSESAAIGTTIEREIKAGIEQHLSEKDLGDFYSEDYRGNVNELDIDIAAGDITFVEGNTFSIKAENVYLDGFKVNHIESSGKIVIKSDHHNKIITNYDWSDTNIVITIPQKHELNRINLKSALGSVDVISTIGKKMDFDLALGSVQMQDIQAEKLTINCNLGKVDIDNALVNGDLKINNNLGGTEFSGRVEGDIDINNSLGDVQLSLENDPQDFTFDLEYDSFLSNINIENKKASEYKYISNDGKYTLSINVSMGRASIDF